MVRTDNAIGNFIKVAQRIPVRITIDPGQSLAKHLAPGMSVVVSVGTRLGTDNEAPQQVSRQ